jgi:hypothetical protein
VLNLDLAEISDLIPFRVVEVSLQKRSFHIVLSLTWPVSAVRRVVVFLVLLRRSSVANMMTNHPL